MIDHFDKRRYEPRRPSGSQSCIYAYYKTNVKIAQFYRDACNFTTTCRKNYALFAAHSAKTQQRRIKALNSVPFQDKNMRGKNTVIPAATISKEIFIFYRTWLTYRSYYYIVMIMNRTKTKMSCAEIDEKIRRFTGLCRKTGLRVTPQRIEIYKQLISTDEHPSAEILYEKVKTTFPSISFDTVNRTLLTLSRIGAASVVEGSGDVRRFDGDLEKHQHFKCIKCKRIVDFHHKPFDDIKVPASIGKRFTVLRKSIYLEGICDLCK